MSTNRVKALLLTFLWVFLGSAWAEGLSSAGTWHFTFDGQDSGNGTATIKADGTITGSGRSAGFGIALGLSGTANDQGAIQITARPSGNTTTGATFTGHASGDTASGVWRNARAGLTGRWTARRSAAAQAPGAATCTGVYEGHYDGSLSGVMSISIGKNQLFSSGFAATGGHDGESPIGERLKLGEGHGVKTFFLTMLSAGEPCSLSLTGRWVAPMNLSYSQPRQQDITFTGTAVDDSIIGHYSFGDESTEISRGSFVLKRVR